MSRNVIMVGSTMRIPLLYRGEYSQWREMFMKYLEEQTDGEAMINSIQNGDQPLPVITQVSLAGNAQNAPPTLKDPKFWTAEEKKTRKIDRLARSLLIQGLPNDIYSLIDSNETAKDLWMLLKDRCMVLRYKKKPVVISSDPLALVAEKTKVSKQKEKVVVSSDSEGSGAYDFNELKKIIALLAKDFNRRKFYSKPKNNNLRTSSTSQSANKKQEFVKSNDKKVEKKANGKKRDMRKVKCYNRKKEGHFAKDCKQAKVKDYNYYKTKILLAKKDSDEQVLLAEDQAWMESNENSSSAKETIDEVAYYTFESESESEFETSEYYDNSTNYSLFVNNDDDQEIFYDAIKSASKNFIENHIDSQKDYDKSEVDHNDSEAKEHLVDKLIRKFNHKIAKFQKLQYAKLEEERYEYMIRYSTLCDNDKQHRKKIDEQEILFDKMSRQLVEMNNNVLKLQEKILEKDTKISELEWSVSDKDVEIKKCLERLNECENKLHKIRQKNQTIHMIMPPKDTLYNGRKGIGFEKPCYFKKAKDLRPSLYDEKVIGLGENDCHVVEKECDKVENSTVIAHGMYKLSVSQSVSPISMSKTSCDSKNVENLDTFSSVRRPKHSGFIWKKKGSSNTSNVDLSSVSHLKLNKDVKMCDLFDDNNLFIFHDESVRISPVSKIPFRKKLCGSINVRSKNCLDFSLDHRFEMFKAYDG
nr:hypothetical protein [Tanacetum cinerariifolium]